MKTVNIERKKEEESWEKYHSNMKFFLTHLYKNSLKNDDKFHVFYEPSLIIRISNLECLKYVEEFFHNNGYSTLTYSYPMDESGKSYFGKIGEDGKTRYGEMEDGIVMRNFDLFINLFHIHSVAAITLSDEDHFSYLERNIHCAFNPRLISRQDEGEKLLRLGLMKCSSNTLYTLLSGKK